MKRLVLIDGHAVLHRAYHALPKSLTTKEGQPVNAVYGFARMLFKIISDLRPDYLAVAFDLPEPTFRHKIYKDYQATRPEIDKELADQIEPAHKMLGAFDIPVFEKAGFEADDVIGTLAKKAKADQVVIVTGDRDIFQLINPQTKVYALKRGISGGELIDASKVAKTLGIKPNQVVDYKALVGDPADNYPGIAGIGPKRAQKLLKKFGRLERIYENLDRLPKKTAKRLKEGEESAKLSKILAQIREDVPLSIDWPQCQLNYDKEKVRKTFQKFGFRSLMKELEKKNEQMRLI